MHSHVALFAEEQVRLFVSLDADQERLLFLQYRILNSLNFKAPQHKPSSLIVYLRGGVEWMRICQICDS